MKNESSPEEKLLNIIKNSEHSSRRKKKADSTADEALKPVNGSYDQPAAAVFNKGKPRDIRSFQKAAAYILEFLILLSIGLLVYQFTMSPYLSNPLSTSLDNAHHFVGQTVSADASGRSLRDYQKLLAKKTIFKSIGKPIAKKSNRSQARKGPGIRELTRGFSLSGILMGSKPQAIIQDKIQRKSVLCEGRRTDSRHGCR